MSKDTGGPAFPAPEASKIHYGENNADFYSGMTLRDWFAGEAMKALLGSDSWLDALGKQVGSSFDNRICQRSIAELSFTFADAMLAERAK